MAEDKGKRYETDSGIELRPVYGPESVVSEERPGTYPFTRGIHPDMYRGRLWTMRQYAGYGSASETNARFRYLLDEGQTGLSVAFDLPTQMGYDSDHQLALGEVGRVGVAIDTLADMETLFDGIPLDKVSTSMTINAPASLLLLMYELAGEKHGVDATQLRGTIQNDILKEYVARGTYIFPPKPSMRLVVDSFRYCRERLPRWNMISISGYHMREAGATAVQELAFTFANAIAYVEAALKAGLSVDEIGPQLSFFFNAHTNFFEEVAKFRAARKIWAKLMKERFGARDPKSMMLRFHTQTGGSTLTSKEPYNNVSRVAFQALSAVLGGTQSLHTNSFDEALALPTEDSVRIALRTQQLLGYEIGVADVADPLGGSYLVEALTSEIEQKVDDILREVEKLGGAVAAIECGYVAKEINQSAYRAQCAVDGGERIVVGVNKFASGSRTSINLLRVDPQVQDMQVESLNRVRRSRDSTQVALRLAELREAARSNENLLYPMKEALRSYASVGEVCNVLRAEFGAYGGSAV